jgi:ABC-type molybdate transport system substrate-binding protein
LFSTPLAAQTPAAAPGRISVSANVLLQAPLDAAVERFTKQSGIAVGVRYNANAALIDDIKPGALPDVVVALDLPGPMQLEEKDGYGDVHVVARTAMCLLAPAALAQARTAAELLSDPTVPLIVQFAGSYVTPYADRVLAMLDRVHPGAAAAANARARVLAAEAPNVAATVLATKAAFLTYCSFAAGVAAAHGELKAVELPVAFNSTIAFDLVARDGAAPEVKRLVNFLESDDVKSIFAAASFTGLRDALAPGEGALTYNSYVRTGALTSYMTHYIYKYPDGHVEEDDIPWPFRYSNAFDPFVRAAPAIPMQPPPPGFVPDRPLKPILLELFPRPAVKGVAVRL